MKGDTAIAANTINDLNFKTFNLGENQLFLNEVKVRPDDDQNASQEGGDIGIGLMGVSLDEIDKTGSSVGIFTQKMALGYYSTGWGGSQYVNTLKLGEGFGRLSTGLSIYTTGKSYWDIGHGNGSVLTYSDATVGTIGLGAKLASHYYGIEIPYVGEGVAIYGTARLGWDVGSIMAEGNAEYIESSKKEGCNVCLLDH